MFTTFSYLNKARNVKIIDTDSLGNFMFGKEGNFFCICAKSTLKLEQSFMELGWKLQKGLLWIFFYIFDPHFVSFLRNHQNKKVFFNRPSY